MNNDFWSTVVAEAKSTSARRAHRRISKWVAAHEAGHAVASLHIQRELDRPWCQFTRIVIQTDEEAVQDYVDDRGRVHRFLGMVEGPTRYDPIGFLNDNPRQRLNAVSSEAPVPFAGSVAYASESQLDAFVAGGCRAVTAADDLVALVKTCASLVDEALHGSLQLHRAQRHPVVYLRDTWETWFGENDVAWRDAATRAMAGDYDGVASTLRFAITASCARGRR